MGGEFVEVIKYLRVRHRELRGLCDKDKESSTVSVQIRAASEDILVRTKRQMDQSLHNFFDRSVAPQLSEKELRETRIYFPLADDEHSMRSTLGRGKMLDLEKRHPEVFRFIESLQPYQDGRGWMRVLNQVATDGHVKLVKQHKKRNHVVSITNAVQITGSVLMKNVNINGYAVEELRVDDNGLRLRAPRPVPIEYRAEVTYQIDGTDINVIWLCEKAIEEAENIEQKLNSLN